MTTLCYCFSPFRNFEQTNTSINVHNYKTVSKTLHTKILINNRQSEA